MILNQGCSASQGFLKSLNNCSQSCITLHPLHSQHCREFGKSKGGWPGQLCFLKHSSCQNCLMWKLTADTNTGSFRAALSKTSGVVQCRVVPGPGKHREPSSYSPNMCLFMFKKQDSYKTQWRQWEFSVASTGCWFRPHDIIFVNLGWNH